MILARKKRKISQEELAKELEVYDHIIERYESNDVKPIFEIAPKINRIGLD